MKKILFVCLGNICRSPSAEAVFRGLVEEKGEGYNYVIDSAGTSDWHRGEPADKRMQRHAMKRGYNLTSISRPFEQNDFDKFDLIVVMDRENLDELKRKARNKSDRKKLFLMTDFSKKYNYEYIPDPYFGGDEGFELVLDLLEDAGEGLYRFVQQDDLRV